MRKRCRPLAHKCFSRGLKKWQHTTRRENRTALKKRTTTFFQEFGWLIRNTPGGVRGIIHFLKNNKGNRLKTIAEFFNPATVRTETVAEYRRHSGVITGMMAGGTAMGILVIVLAILAISGGSDDGADTTVVLNALTAAEPPGNVSEGSDTAESSRLAKESETTAAQADFYNPFYVFTHNGAKAVSAYPLADPPGIVVDVHGVRKADASPEEMVGKDDRVVGVRRLVTSKGLRYIIRTSQSIKRIKSQMDGNIITVSPLS